MTPEAIGSPIRVLLADDDSIVRSTLASVIDATPDMQVANAVGTGSEAVDWVRRDDAVDVVLMDVRMPQQDGIGATRDIKAIRPSLPVVLLTSLEDAGMLREAFRVKANGLLLKGDGVEAILGAVRAAHHGTVVISAGTAANSFDVGSTDPPFQLRLSTREQQVLELLCRAYSNEDIGRELHLSESRVKAHVSALISRFRVDSRLKVVVRAFEWGLVAKN